MGRFQRIRQLRPFKRRGLRRPKRPQGTRLSDELRLLLTKAAGGSVNLREIFDSFPKRSHAILIVLLSFPLCSPIGIPIITTLFGPTLGLVSFFLMLGRRPWLPKFMSERRIPYDKLELVMRRLIRIATRFERVLKPRLPLLTSEGLPLRIHGAVCVVLAILVSLPLPIPFLNMAAALPVLLLGLGLLERDGAFVVAGYTAAVPGVLFYAGLLFLGKEGVMRLLHLAA